MPSCDRVDTAEFKIQEMEVAVWARKIFKEHLLAGWTQKCPACGGERHFLQGCGYQ